MGVECKRKRKQNSLSVVTLMIYWSLVKGRGTKEPLDEGGRGEGKDLKLNIQKIKIMAFSPVTSWQIDGETVETVTDLIFLGSKIPIGSDCSNQIPRCGSLEEKL